MKLFKLINHNSNMKKIQIMKNFIFNNYKNNLDLQSILHKRKKKLAIIQNNMRIIKRNLKINE